MTKDWTYDPDPLIDILILHQRLDIKGCLCGWNEIGRSHAKHVADLIYEAGFQINPSERKIN